MAVLELGIELNNIQIASKALDGLQKQLSSLGGKKIDVGAGAFNEARTRAQEALAKLREYNLEQKKIKAISPDLNPYQKLSRELTEMRNEAKSLGAQLILLEKAGMGSGVMANTLRNRFDAAQKEVVELDASVKKLDSSLGQNQRNVGNYANGMGNAAGVTMEFNRIIQDAPFGMMGIGNNIQQLIGNWQQYAESSKQAAAANGRTVNSMGLLRGAMTQFLSTGNLITFAVAAITSAWTYYTMNNKSVKESIKELDNAFVGQLGTLKTLITLTEQSSKTERDKATAISMYNKELGETLGKVKNYNELEQKLIENADNYIQYLSLKARAEGIYQLSLEKTKNLLNETMTLSDKGRASGFSGWLTKTFQNPADALFKNIWSGLGVINKSEVETKITPEEALKIAGLPSQKEFEKAIQFYSASIQQGITRLRKQNKGIDEANKLFSDTSKEANRLADLIGGIPMPDLGLDKEKNNAKKLKEAFDYLQKIKDLVGDKQQQNDMFGLVGQAKELKELEYKWKDYYDNLNKLEKDYNADKAPNKQKGVLEAIDSAKLLGDNLKIKEQTELLRKWREEYEKIADQTLLDAGFTAIQSLEKDIALNEAKLKESFKRMLEAGGNFWEALSVIGQAKMMSEYNIKIKWNDKDLEEWGKLNDKIADVLDKPFKGKDRGSLTRELQVRIEELRKAYEKLLRATGGTFDQAEFDRMKLELELQFDSTSKTLFRNFLVDTINSSYQQLMGSLKQNVEQFGPTFRAVFYSIGETIQGAINNINTENINNLFEKIKTSGWQSATAMEKASAGLAMAGNFLSSVTSKTSTVGQGLGGALSGAASMASTGNPYLIAAGAGLGLLSGILGAGKAKKEEERQRQQLEEQKKTNALLERMNALAYTSQIIGGKTTNGIVTGVNRNEFGEITVRIEGRDLVGSFNRTNTLSGR